MLEESQYERTNTFWMVLNAEIASVACSIEEETSEELQKLGIETDKRLCSILTDDQKGCAAFSRWKESQGFYKEPPCYDGVRWEDPYLDCKAWVDYALSQERTYLIEKL